MTVQRYRHSIYGMAEEAEGEWVDFEDFEALAIERDGLRGRVSELERLVEMGPVPPACSAEDFAGAVLEVDALTRERDELRREVERFRLERDRAVDEASDLKAEINALEAKLEEKT